MGNICMCAGMNEPVAQQVASFTKAENVAQHDQCDADPLKQLCLTLGSKPDINPCTLANIPRGDVKACVGARGGQPPAAGVLAQCGLIWETSQYCCGRRLQAKIDAKTAADLKEANGTLGAREICIVPGPICAFCRTEITRSQGMEECPRCYAGPFHLACYRYHVCRPTPLRDGARESPDCPVCTPVDD